LTGDLPQFLSALGVGTPAIRIFFDIFLSEHGLEGSPSMIEIQHILDQEVVGIKGGDEQFVDPVTGLPGAGARCRVTITRAAGNPSSRGSQPPSNSSMTSPVLRLVTLAVGG
jgi:hypothetical protein